ncbi:MAG: ribonuclease Z [Cyanobacteria bacterium P01_F01_bin.42]
MQITFLGTSSGVPTRSRNVSSVAVRLPQRSEVWLFDCGEGTQHQFIRSDLKISQISRIFITHMHGDHVFGLMGLLASCGLAGNVSKIDLYGPPALEPFIKNCRKYSQTHFSYPVTFHQVRPGVVYEDRDFVVSCEPLEHRVTAFGYRITEKPKAGRFDVEKAKKMGIPFGPIYGRLKRGELVNLPDGRTFHGADFCGPLIPGRSFVYCTDTIFCDAAVRLSADADVLVHESTFSHQDADMAYERYHSTSTMAAQVAHLAAAKHLFLTHFSPRYAPGNPLQLEDLLAEARAIFPNVSLAHDHLCHEIAARKG